MNMFLIIDGDALYQFHQNAAVQTCQVLVGLEIFDPWQMFHIQIVQAIPLAVHFCFGLADGFNLFIKGMAEFLILFLADNTAAHIFIKLAAQGLVFLFFLLQHFQMFFHRFQSAFILGDVQQHGYDSYDDLKKARDELSAKMSDARNTAKSTDADLKLLNEKIHYLGQYLSTKATYKEFLQAGNKKMYRSAHQDEIARYEEAVQFLKRNSTNGTIPTMKNLRAEKEKLLSARTAQYESYIYFKDYYHELQTACRNVDMILGAEHTQQHSRTQPKHSHEPSL